MTSGQLDSAGEAGSFQNQPDNLVAAHQDSKDIAYRLNSNSFDVHS